MKIVALFAAVLTMVGCAKVQANSPAFPASEKGYHHLMKALKDRSISSCENLEHDGTTCLRIKGQELCGKTRDEAAEVAATWIDKNIAAGCDHCGEETTFTAAEWKPNQKKK